MQFGQGLNRRLARINHWAKLDNSVVSESMNSVVKSSLNKKLSLKPEINRPLIDLETDNNVNYEDLMSKQWWKNKVKVFKEDRRVNGSHDSLTNYGIKRKEWVQKKWFEIWNTSHYKKYMVLVAKRWFKAREKYSRRKEVTNHNQSLWPQWGDAKNSVLIDTDMK